jgi:hypothetical protein
MWLSITEVVVNSSIFEEKAVSSVDRFFYACKTVKINTG